MHSPDLMQIFPFFKKKILGLFPKWLAFGHLGFIIILPSRCPLATVLELNLPYSYLSNRPPLFFLAFDILLSGFYPGFPSTFGLFDKSAFRILVLQSNRGILK
jgi:hypothetical protein